MQARCVREDAKQALTGLSPSLAALGERSISPLREDYVISESRCFGICLVRSVYRWRMTSSVLVFLEISQSSGWNP